MRSPGEAPGMLAFECAMDELAERLGLDPIELGIRNEPEQDPERGVPFSTRNLVACMEEGARRFGWERRNPTPGRARGPQAHRLRHGGGDPSELHRRGDGAGCDRPGWSGDGVGST